MPIKGIILIIAIAVVVAVAERESIYRWLNNDIFGDDEENEEDDFK